MVAETWGMVGYGDRGGVKMWRDKLGRGDGKIGLGRGVRGGGG